LTAGGRDRTLGWCVPYLPPPRVAFLILAIVAVCAAPARAADNGWSRLVAAPTEIAPLASLAVASDGTVYAEADRASFVSHDGAATWQMVGRGYGAPVVDPFDPAHLYTVFNAGDNHVGSIFVTPSSIDGGATWQDLEPAVTGNRCRYVRLIADPTQRGRLFLYTAQRYLANPAVYRSDDGGRSWSPVSLPYSPRMIDVDADGTVYAATHGHGVLRSADAGATWAVGSDGIVREPDGRQIVSQVTAVPGTPGGRPGSTGRRTPALTGRCRRRRRRGTCRICGPIPPTPRVCGVRRSAPS
jgi:photosystem II stability/assembly factor-like uncharacterized protein